MPQAVHLVAVNGMPLRRTPTNLRALLQSALEVLLRQARAFDVTLNVVVDDLVPDVLHLDRDKIAWAITVLVGIALRYVHHGIANHAGRDHLRARDLRFGRSARNHDRVG